METVARLQLARELVSSLEAGDEAAADDLVDRMGRDREAGLFMEVGRLTRELHDALMSVKVDERMAGIAEHEIPDAKQRLNYVIKKTEEAANRTLTAVETVMPLNDRLADAAGRLGGDWQRFTRREMDVNEFKQFCGRLWAFLDEIGKGSSTIQTSMTEILMAQDFQDLTGQVIRRIIALVTEVEDSLVKLIRASGGKVDAVKTHDPLRAEGPQVAGTAGHKQAVSGQDDVDALLSSLGF